MCYFSFQAQNSTISRGFNLISNSRKIQDGGQDGDQFDWQASSSATTHKAYLILLK